ncbi:hypothetical protein L7F22_050609 [Adiantum nelumboides]|nr:hypothetical protein [Adiantum nelumboides]
MVELKLAKTVEPSFGPVFTSIEDPKIWSANFELWLLMDAEKLQTVLLLMQGQSKLWFDGLKSRCQGSWRELQSRFLKRFQEGITREEASKVEGGTSRCEVDELINKEDLHIEVNQEVKIVANVDILVWLKEIKPILVESLHEKAAECSQVADTKDLEACGESEQSHEDGQAFGEQQADKGANAKMVYGAVGDEDISSSCWETNKEDRANESISYGKETEPDEPELVKVKLPYYVVDGMVKLVCRAMLMAMLIKMAVECAIVVQLVQSFAKKNRATIPMEEDKDDAIEIEFLSSLARYDATGEQMLEEQVAEADNCEVLIDLEKSIDEEDLEDAKINCKAGKEESKKLKIELSVLQVCSMIGNGNSHVEAKLLKEVFVWWLKGMVINVAVQKVVEQVKDLLEEDFALHVLEIGPSMFNVSDDVYSESDDAFDGDSLPMDAGSSESMSMVAYVDGWLDAQVARSCTRSTSGTVAQFLQELMVRSYGSGAPALKASKPSLLGDVAAKLQGPCLYVLL